MKKLKFLVGAVALFALVAVNVWNAATTLRGSDLSLADVEAMADPPEWGYLDVLYQTLEWAFTGTNKTKWYEFEQLTWFTPWQYEVTHLEVCDYSDDGSDAGCAWSHTRYWTVTVG